jgi:hypothetical protein
MGKNWVLFLVGLRSATRRARQARRLSYRGGKCARDFFAIHNGDANGFVGAGLHAGGRFVGSEAAGAHVAFANDAAFRRIFWNVVRTFQNTVAAADALIVEVFDDAGDWIFFVGENRTPIQAGGVDAVMAGGGDVALKGFAAANAVKDADAAPDFTIVEAVEGVTGGDAGFAAAAFIEINFEAVLLAGGRFIERDQVAIVAGLGREGVLVVEGGEARDGGTREAGAWRSREQRFLLREQFIDECLCGFDELRGHLEVDVETEIEPVRVLRAGDGERFFDVFAGEKMAVTGFERCLWIDVVGGN